MQPNSNPMEQAPPLPRERVLPLLGGYRGVEHTPPNYGEWKEWKGVEPEWKLRGVEWSGRSSSTGSGRWWKGVEFRAIAILDSLGFA
jgi:hypothetical protein